MLLIKDIPSRSLQLQKVITGQNTKNNWCPASAGEITTQFPTPSSKGPSWKTTWKDFKNKRARGSAERVSFIYNRGAVWLKSQQYGHLNKSCRLTSVDRPMWIGRISEGPVPRRTTYNQWLLRKQPIFSRDEPPRTLPNPSPMWSALNTWTWLLEIESRS